MSADRKRLTSALRRIVKTDPDVRSLLKAAESKGGKPGAAGVGSSTEAQQARVCCDGSIGDNPNPGTDERDPDSGGQDGGLNGSDPALLDMGEGTLSGVTDCATGEPICFSGSGFIPPDGWDDIDSQPYLESYTEGFYYNDVRSSVDVREPTEEAFIETFVAVSAPGTEPGRYIMVPGSQCSGGSFPDCGTPFAVADTGFHDGYCVTCVSYLECPDGSTADYCNPTEEEIRATQWPTDSCVNLAIIDGTIVGSKYDPENDGSYSAPRSSIDLCDGNGNQISLAPSGSIEGGWKTLNSTNDSGYLYDSSGNVIAHIDGNEYSDPAM